MTLTVYTLESSDAWTSALGRFPAERADIYYTPAYLQTWVGHETATPRCLHIANGKTEFLYPFLMKALPETLGEPDCFDIFSAYGYGGMIANRPIADINAQIMQEANATVDAWCRDHRIIAEFIRENPGDSVDGRYVRTAEHMRVRQNVYAWVSGDYTIPSRSARRNIARARRQGLTVSWDPDMASMDRFIELYCDTANHGEWDAYYRFDADYFRGVADRLRGVGAIVNIHRGEDIAAAAIVFFYGCHTTYHLSGSLPEARNDRPNDLMINAILVEADRRNAPMVSLGGGMSTSPEDPLFAFKYRFGNQMRDVHVGKHVHDFDVYNRVCDRWAARHPELAETYRHFLLKYRMGEPC